jgi:hypothetical protein
LATEDAAVGSPNYVWSIKFGQRLLPRWMLGRDCLQLMKMHTRRQSINLNCAINDVLLEIVSACAMS